MLGVPVGLVTSNWGGSTIETWMNIDGIKGIDKRYKLNGQVKIVPLKNYLME